MILKAEDVTMYPVKKHRIPLGSLVGRAVLGVLVVCTTAAAGSPGEKPAATSLRVKLFSLADPQGNLHTQNEWPGRKAVVLIFLGTECPVSNGYAPTMARLAKTYGAKGVAFYGVHPDSDVTAEVAAKHGTDYKLPFVLLLDPKQTLPPQAGVTVVPEAVVLTPGGQVLYCGRIDDRYSLDGRRRDEPRTRDLENAIESVLAGRRPNPARTAAFGCPLPPPAEPGR
jgi:thiol-disulfide isomerase/thioredoxin